MSRWSKIFSRDSLTNLSQTSLKSMRLWSISSKYAKKEWKRLTRRQKSATNLFKLSSQSLMLLKFKLISRSKEEIANQTKRRSMKKQIPTLINYRRCALNNLSWFLHSIGRRRCIKTASISRQS